MVGGVVGGAVGGGGGAARARRAAPILRAPVVMGVRHFGWSQRGGGGGGGGGGVAGDVAAEAGTAVGARGSSAAARRPPSPLPRVQIYNINGAWQNRLCLDWVSDDYDAISNPAWRFGTQAWAPEWHVQACDEQQEAVMCLVTAAGVVRKGVEGDGKAAGGGAAATSGATAAGATAGAAGEMLSAYVFRQHVMKILSYLPLATTTEEWVRDDEEYGRDGRDGRDGQVEREEREERERRMGGDGGEEGEGKSAGV